MPDGFVILAFVAASLAVLLTPGPGVAYVTARGLAQGKRAGLVSAAGLSAGAYIHVLAAAAGLSSLLLASATAFTIVKYAGAAYLIYLGLRLLFGGAGKAAQSRAPQTASAARLFTDGVMVSALNPKIALFFLAFLPQFIDPAAGPVTVQILGLGLLYCVIALITDGAYGLFAAHVRDWTATRWSRSRLPRVLSGSIFIGLGIQTALTERPG
ncbi:MAG: LysE family translocator [Pseudomonadota bacterium]